MKTFKLLIAIFAVALLFSQCKYDFIVPVEVIDPDDPNVEQVSFSAEIAPIFANNNCAACHDSGRAPDLTAGNIYSSIVPTYVNLDNPAESLIYTKPNPSGSHPRTYSEAQAALILTWITQGAENN